MPCRMETQAQDPAGAGVETTGQTQNFQGLNALHAIRKKRLPCRPGTSDRVSVKVAEINRLQERPPKLKRFGMADIPAGAIGDGAIQRSGKRRQKPSASSSKSSNVKETNVAVSIGGYSGHRQKDQRPDECPKNSSRRPFHFEAEQYIPLTSAM